MRFGILIAVLILEKSYRSRPTRLPVLASADMSLLGLERKKPAADHTNPGFVRRILSTQNGVSHARKSLKARQLLIGCKLGTFRVPNGEARPDTPVPTAIFACF